jgi:hypothetical protein
MLKKTLLVLALVGISQFKMNSSVLRRLPSSTQYQRAEVALDHDSRESISYQYGQVTPKPARMVLERAPTQKYHIFQISKPHTGSTLMTNLLIGLVSHDPTNEHVVFLEKEARILSYRGKIYRGSDCNVTVVTKTHQTKVDRLTKLFASQFDRLYFVAVNRGKKKSVSDRYCRNYTNVLCFEYGDTVYNSTSPDEEASNRANVVHRVRKALQDKFEYFAGYYLDETAAVKRLEEMDTVVEEYKQYDFTRVNHKFEIHGGHRNRVVAIQNKSMTTL